MSDQDYDGYTPSQRTFEDAIEEAPVRNEWYAEASAWQLLKHAFNQATLPDYVIMTSIFFGCIFTICYLT